jgi:pantoate--beta-alanine ligase
MKILRSLSEIHDYRAEHPQQIAFVPTMGNLHDGHLKLVTQARAFSPIVLASIYVNPTQFNDPTDFAKYPRTIEEDLEKLQQAGCSAVYLPAEGDLYPDDYRFQIKETDFSRTLCGQFRPGHFEGVLTIVMKLLHLSGARWLILGLKDYQQYRLVSDLCRAFFVPVEVIGVETVREPSGLAMSSRNNRLTAQARQQIAPQLFRVISEPHYSDEKCRQTLEDLGFHVEYVESHFGRRFVAAFLEGVRLIDNVEKKESTAKEVLRDLDA